MENRSLDDSPEAPPRKRGRRERELAQILGLLSRSPSVRSELVADIRAQVRAGTYVNAEKLDLAIYRMLKDVLG